MGDKEDCSYGAEDQIGKIILKLDTLTDEDKEFIDTNRKKRYVQFYEEFYQNNPQEGIKLKRQFEYFPKEMKDLIYGLLEFNPDKRLAT